MQSFFRRRALCAVFLTVLTTASFNAADGAGDITVVFDASITNATFKSDVNYAAAQWNSLLGSSPYATTITFDLKNIGAATTAGLTTYNTLDGSNRVATSTIDFNTNSSFFVDPTPGNNNEFNMQTTYLRQNAPAAPDQALSGYFGNANGTVPAAGGAQLGFGLGGRARDRPRLGHRVQRRRSGRLYDLCG